MDEIADLPCFHRYNSLMLGLTLWSVNFLQAGHDLLGAVAFVLSLGFKQMALYYSPAMQVPPLRISSHYLLTR